ncbi:Furin, partial, partial [Paramuricea clavata]
YRVSLLRGISTNDKGKLIWVDSLESLKLFVEEVLNIANGIWICPGGEAKQFKSKDLDIRWYPTTKSITVSGNLENEIKEKLHSLASISKQLLVNAENLGVDETTPPQNASLKNINDFMVNSNLAGVDVLDLQDSRAISLSDNDTTNGSFQACEESVSCNEESVIQNVIKRNRLLKEENKALQTEITKCKDTLTELNTKLTDTESEKSSLLTVIRLLNEEQATVMCSNKDESSQAQQTRSSWQIAGRKTTSQSVGHHINLSNKYSTLQIEDDDEAVMSGDAGNNQTVVPKMTPTIDHEKKRRLKNTLRNIQDTKQNSLPTSNQRDTIQPKKQQCDVAFVGDSMIKHVDVRKLRHGTNKQVTVRTFSGCRTDEMAHYIKPTLALKPKQVIIHVGTNDLKTKSPAEIIYNLKNLGNQAKQENPRTGVSLSQIIIRSDDTRLQNKLVEVNKCIQDLCEQENWGLIDNSNISNMHLNPYGLHLNKRGSALLAKNIKLHITSNIDNY